MASTREMIVWGCDEDDLELCRRVLGPRGPALSTVDRPMKVAQQVVTRQPVAVILGIDTGTARHLDLIPVIRGVRPEVPVIVIAREESLELERAAREKGVFYYLVHPLDEEEVRAVLENLTHSGRG